MSGRKTSEPTFSAAEVARMTGIATARTWRAWGKNQQIPAIVLPNGNVRFRLSDIEAVLTPRPVRPFQGDTGDESDPPVQHQAVLDLGLARRV